MSHVHTQAREIALSSRVQELSFIGLGNGVPLKVRSFVYIYAIVVFALHVQDGL